MIALIALLAAVPAVASPMSLYQQRAAYRQAVDHLAAGRHDEYRRLRETLDGYLLAPYLDYHDYKSRLSGITDAEMARFQKQHGELPVAEILHFRWLKALGRDRQWQRLLDNYQPSTDAELACYHLRALLATGERQAAMAGVAPLWLVGRSQPEACDPLFEAWIDDGHLTEGQVWERLRLALAGGEKRLGRYLLRFFEGPLTRWAELLYEVHLHPETLLRPGTVAEDNRFSRAVIAHGLRRLTRRDVDGAAAAWQRYRDTHRFPAAEAQALDEHIVLALARQGEFPLERPASVSADFAEGMAEAALAAENWRELLVWIERLPQERRSDLRWQYWLARALSHSRLDSERAEVTYRALSDERHYYGFLAAERLGLPPRLNDAAAAANPARLEALRRMPAIARALELYAVGDLVNARREWYALVPRLNAAQQYHAGVLAQQAGWINQGIHTANAAQLRDSVDLRFPVAYPELFQQVSHATTVPQPFLLAIARQESAFDPRARSHADARGLMQLVPPTARLVARRAGLELGSSAELYDPAVNVKLGGHHLARLLDRYGHRRAVAAAAYNAGENRVDRWLESRQNLSPDVWIETIPYRETRDYVKNVLAFTKVYGQLLDHPLPVLDASEPAVN